MRENFRAFSNILTCNFWTFFFCAWRVFLVRLLHCSYCWEQQCPGTGSLSLWCLRPASSIELLQMSFQLTFWKIKRHQQAEKLLNEQRAFIHLNGLSNKKCEVKRKQTLSETGWESISCQSAFQSLFAVIVSKSMTTSGLKEQKDTSKSTDAQATAVDMDSFS